jgi:hypothetical protein
MFCIKDAVVPCHKKKKLPCPINLILISYSYFRSHYSASGCPIANRNKMRVLENGGTIEHHKAAVAAATAMKFDGVNCPQPGCDGI